MPSCLNETSFKDELLSFGGLIATVDRFSASNWESMSKYPDPSICAMPLFPGFCGFGAISMDAGSSGGIAGLSWLPADAKRALGSGSRWNCSNFQLRYLSLLARMV